MYILFVVVVLLDMILLELSACPTPLVPLKDSPSISLKPLFIAKTFYDIKRHKELI